MGPVFSSPSPVSPLVDLLPLSLGPRDSETAVGTERSVVVDRVTAQYTHTLTVTGRLPGVYTCTVDNEVSPQDSESFTVEGTVVVVLSFMTTVYCYSFSCFTSQ